MKRGLAAVALLTVALAPSGGIDFAQGAAPTFTKDVAPILYARCTGCHRPGQLAPMSLLTYDAARPWARSMRRVATERRMPPWFADPSIGKFVNDPTLSDAEIAT